MNFEDIDPAYMGRLIAYHLSDEMPKMLRAISFSYTRCQLPTPGQVIIRAHFFTEPTDDDLEALSLMLTYLYSDTPFEPGHGSAMEYETEIQLAPTGSKIYPREYLAWIDPMEQHRKP